MVHEKAPHIKSLMIAGPRGTGKKMLVNSICTETGSNMFDLSPLKIASATRYAGKAGLNMLLHMVFKVRRSVYSLVQPLDRIKEEDSFPNVPINAFQTAEKRNTFL